MLNWLQSCGVSDERHSVFTDLLQVLCHIVIADSWNLSQRLQRNILNILILYLQASEDTTHDIVALVGVHEVFSCRRHDSLECLDGVPAYLWVLAIYILYCAIKDSLDLIFVKCASIILMELRQDAQGHHDGQSVEVIFVLRVLAHEDHEIRPLSSWQLDVGQRGKAQTCILNTLLLLATELRHETGFYLTAR